MGEQSNPPTCPLCGAPAVKTMVGGINVFRCGTEGPDSAGEYVTGHACDIAILTREIERLRAEIGRLNNSLAAAQLAGDALESQLWELAENERNARVENEELRKKLTILRNGYTKCLKNGMKTSSLEEITEN